MRLLSKKRKELTAIGGLVLFLLIIIAPSPTGLSIAAKNSLAVFILSLIFWVSNIIPLPVTSLMGMALIPTLNILSVEETFALFGNKSVFFILGALILAAGLYKTGLGSRMALSILKIFGDSPQQLIFGVMITAALLSCIMPEHAAAAMLFPIVKEIAKSLELDPLKSNYGKLLFLAMAWGAIIGGITTFLGGARNPLAVGLLEESYGITIGFFEWVRYAWPIPVIGLGLAYILILRLIKIDINNVEKAKKVLQIKIKEQGSLSLEEKKLAIIFSLVLGAWLFLPQIIDISLVALLGVGATFILKVVEWKEIEGYVNWGVILMFGGAIVIATALNRTGATEWFSELLFSRVDLSPFAFLALISIFTIFLTEGISNVAAVAIILPLGYSLGDVYGINPIVTTLSVALPGGLAFCLPMGTPPNAIAFSSGYYDIKDSISVGIILNIASWFIYLFVVRFYWPFIGLEIII